MIGLSTRMACAVGYGAMTVVCGVIILRQAGHVASAHYVYLAMGAAAGMVSAFLLTPGLMTAQTLFGRLLWGAAIMVLLYPIFAVIVVAREAMIETMTLPKALRSFWHLLVTSVVYSIYVTIPVGAVWGLLLSGLFYHRRVHG